MLNNPAFHLLFVVMFVKSIFCLINPLALFQSSPTLSGAVIDRPVICNKLILVFHHDEKPCLCIIKCKVWFWISFLVDRSYRSNRGCSTLCVCACYKISDYSDIFRSGVLGWSPLLFFSFPNIYFWKVYLCYQTKFCSREEEEYRLNLIDSANNFHL